MVTELFHTLVSYPLYNALVGLLNIGPWVDVGMAVVVLTLFVKLALFPLSLKAARTQRLMKELEEPMKEIKEKYKDNREEQGKKLLELYKEKKVNPFSSILVMFIQIPVILGLFFLFAKGGLPEINQDMLYSFVAVPENVSMMLLGVIDMADRNIVLAILAGLTQHIQVRLSMPPAKPRGENATFQEDFARSMQMQMKYVLPIMIIGFAYVLTAAVALYWITSNIFGIGQEVYVKNKMKAEKENKDE